MNQIAAPTTEPKTFRDMLTSFRYKEQLQQALPRGVTAERMVRVVLTAMNRNQKLLECTKESLWQSVLDCASLGLFPDALGRAYLVPYKDKCQLIIGWKGLVDLAYRSDRIASIQIVVVRAGDHFKREPLAMPPIQHVIKEADGDAFRLMTHVYSVVYLKDCANPSVDVMSKREVDEIRARSKSGGSGPWVTDYEEMAKKSVFRRHSKVLPMSAELVQAMEADGESLQLDVPAPANRFEDAKPADATVRPSITPALCVELAKALPEALVLDLMAKYQIHAVGDIRPDDIAHFHADLVAGKA